MAVVHMRTWQAAYRDLMPSNFLEQLNVDERAERWRRTLSNTQGDHFVMEDKAGRAVGFCSVLPSPDAEDAESIGVITALYVDPPHWRRGFTPRSSGSGRKGRCFHIAVLPMLTSRLPA